METQFVSMNDTYRNFVGRTPMTSLHVSTLAEYHQAGPGVKNRAGDHIDAGRTAYLVNADYEACDLNPYVEIIDLFIKPDGALIGVDLMTGQEWLPGDTLVVWR